MNKFIETPASSRSLLMRKPVFGVGINDAEYKTHLKINGKRYECHFYAKWHGMLKRAYYQPYKEKNKTYKEVTVCSEWLVFSVFKAWMIKQDWHGKELDKDILTQGNKVYYPNACCFVDKEVNSLLVSCSSTKGIHKAGVFLRKDIVTNKFKSYCNDNGKAIHLGYYGTEDEAHEAYCKHKYKVIARVANYQSEQIKIALLNYRIIS